MGHGTTVPGEFDIDLVIYSRGKLYTSVHVSYMYFKLHI